MNTKDKPFVKKLTRWVKKNKTFAMAVPIMVGCCSFLVVGQVNALKEKSNSAEVSDDGFNTEMPGDEPKNEMIKNDNMWFGREEKKEAQMEVPVEMIAKKEDSLEKVLNELDALSMDNITFEKQAAPLMEREKEVIVDLQQERQKLIEEKLAYREMLKQGFDDDEGNERPEALRETIGPEEAASKGGAVFRAIVYKDQFVLPDDMAKLMLTEDAVMDGKIFRKNTILNALVSIKKNRIYLKIDNINHVPVNVVVNDFNDGLEGLYSKKAGELWNDFSIRTQGNVLEDVANELNTNGNSTINAVTRNIGSFFRKKKLKKKDRIPLINDRELLVVQQ